MHRPDLNYTMYILPVSFKCEHLPININNQYILRKRFCDQNLTMEFLLSSSSWCPLSLDTYSWTIDPLQPSPCYRLRLNLTTLLPMHSVQDQPWSASYHICADRPSIIKSQLNCFRAIISPHCWFTSYLYFNNRWSTRADPDLIFTESMGPVK